jgi:hypothetical protein
MQRVTQPVNETVWLVIRKLGRSMAANNIDAQYKTSYPNAIVI